MTLTTRLFIDSEAFEQELQGYWLNVPTQGSHATLKFSLDSACDSLALIVPSNSCWSQT